MRYLESNYFKWNDEVERLLYLSELQEYSTYFQKKYEQIIRKDFTREYNKKNGIFYYMTGEFFGVVLCVCNNTLSVFAFPNKNDNNNVTNKYLLHKLLSDNDHDVCVFLSLLKSSKEEKEYEVVFKIVNTIKINGDEEITPTVPIISKLCAEKTNVLDNILENTTSKDFNIETWNDLLEYFIYFSNKDVIANYWANASNDERYKIANVARKINELDKLKLSVGFDIDSLDSGADMNEIGF